MNSNTIQPIPVDSTQSISSTNNYQNNVNNYGSQVQQNNANG